MARRLLSLALLSMVTGCEWVLDFDGISDGKSRAVVPSPRAYWRLDEEEGARAADSVGSSDGALTLADGSPAWTRGRHGHALAFTKGHGRLTVPALSGKFERAGSIAIWTKAATLPNERRRVFSAAAGTEAPLELSLENDRFVWDANGSDSALFIDAVVADRWFLVVAMWDLDARDFALYLRPDGGRGSLQRGTAGGELGDATFELEHPDGILDDVRFFARVLTRPELDAID